MMAFCHDFYFLQYYVDFDYFANFILQVFLKILIIHIIALTKNENIKVLRSNYRKVELTPYMFCYPYELKSTCSQPVFIC